VVEFTGDARGRLRSGALLLDNLMLTSPPDSQLQLSLAAAPTASGYQGKVCGCAVMPHASICPPAPAPSCRHSPPTVSVASSFLLPNTFLSSACWWPADKPLRKCCLCHNNTCHKHLSHVPTLITDSQQAGRGHAAFQAA
jgi:hypothetical protein